MNINLKKIILFCGFILFLSGIASARPNTKICRKRNGKFPMPGTLCKRYYECKNFVPEEKTCKDGEHFNANKEWCDWEELYPCLEKVKDKECLRQNGLFLKPGTECKKYYRCCNGKAQEETCPGDSLFDPSKENCEWPDLYTCIEKPEWKKCPSPNGLFLKPRTNCKKYYNCTNGRPNEKCCQKNTLFNPSKGKCEPSQFYTCIEPSERKECPRRNGQFLKPRTNCRKYYNCSNGEPEEQQCSKNTLFNPTTEKCESAEFYTCIEKPERKECPKRNGKFLKPGTNCLKYYECLNGEPEEKKCPIGKLFNPSTENCEMMEKYTCIEKPERKECPKRNGKFLKPGTNCMKYYECSNGEPEERKCPIGKLFNPSTENCEMTEKYTCIETPDKNKCTRRNGKFLKPGTTCKEYYKCSDGILKSKKCERNMLFNPSSEKCESSKIYTCVESLSTTEKVPSTVTTFATSTTPDDQKEKTATDPVVSTTTTQKTTSTEQITYSTQDPDSERTNSRISETTNKIITQPPPTDGQSIETSTISETITSTIAATLSTIEISTTSAPTTTESSTLQSTTEISTLPSTTEISSSESTTETSTLQTTSSEISIISQTVSPQMSSTHSTNHTISKENKEGEITEPTLFETTMEVTFSPSTEEVTTSDELNVKCPEPNGYFPHPTDKHKFIVCAHDIPSIFTCPSNLVYKQRVRRCEYE
ncbi:uncharacterized protein LOC129964266 [Argiope bruennichi]|uniref:uncharacterized protein LOC129964266 n=1 Tax=Argiope bruennichi TaxID=94029 RepID=UPI00249531F7|nr:uncharacterized protein LOC129964266 [Argiope bruennichi]